MWFGDDINKLQNQEQHKRIECIMRGKNTAKALLTNKKDAYETDTSSSIVVSSNIFWLKPNKYQISKNSVSKSIVDVIKHANFHLYRAYPVGVIWKNGQLPTNAKTSKFELFLHQNMCVSKTTC